MKSLIIATGIFLIFPLPSLAVPVVPNFGAGSVTSRTETESTQTEIIQSWHYNTGYTFSQSGSNLKVLNGSSLTPTTANTQTQTVNGISSTWTNINLNSKPTMGQHVTYHDGIYAWCETYIYACMHACIHTYIHRYQHCHNM